MEVKNFFCFYISIYICQANHTPHEKQYPKQTKTAVFIFFKIFPNNTIKPHTRSSLCRGQKTKTNTLRYIKDAGHLGGAPREQAIGARKRTQIRRLGLRRMNRTRQREPPRSQKDRLLPAHSATQSSEYPKISRRSLPSSSQSTRCNIPVCPLWAGTVLLQGRRILHR